MRYGVLRCRNNRRRGITPVGAAILPPATFRLQPVRMNGTTQCSGDDSSPSNVSNITCAVERNHPPICHSEGAKASRGIFPSGKLYLVLVLSSTWWIPPLRWRCGRNDIRFWFDCYRFKRTTIPAYAGWRQIAAATLRGTIQPHRLYSKRGGRQIAAPTCTSVGNTIQPHRLYSERPGRLVADK